MPGGSFFNFHQWWDERTHGAGDRSGSNYGGQTNRREHLNLELLGERLEAPFIRIIGETEDGSGYLIARWVFLRALGVVYLIAFASLWVQVQGLIGPDGILPAKDWLDLLRQHLGTERYRLVPSLFWLGAGSRALHLVSGAGVLASMLLVLDLWPRACLVALWGLYLSLVSVGQDFLAFQWDVLLLEAGFLAVFLSPGYLLPRRSTASPNPLAVFLLWGLLFRLVFESGVVKLTSGDPTWRDLTALDYHYFTQPLPTWTAWYSNLLPSSLKRLQVAITFLIELGAPVLLFCGRRARLAGCAAIVLLQILILATGNYTFFNLLAIALALLLIDDRIWRRLMPETIRRIASPVPATRRRAPRILAMTAVGVPLLLLQLASCWAAVVPGASLPGVVDGLLGWVAPFRSLNSYGLFRVMTTKRAEIVVEGSDDGSTWRPYEFRYKPGALDRRPGFVEPHQPRLDWQMWFAALDQFERTNWFQAFLLRLLQGSPPVLQLLATNPFPDHPPRWLRATLYDYRFTDRAGRRATGEWWTRRELGPYSPVVRLADTSGAPNAR